MKNPSESKTRTLLLVDDDMNLRGVTRMYLESHFGDQVRIVEAEDGAQALKCLHEREIALAVTNGNMPNVSGLELIKEIRARGLAVPVVMFTGEDQEYREQAVALGAQAALNKNQIDELLEVVEAVLREK